jgi:hypothetical protein
VAEICGALSEREIEMFFDRWIHALASPLPLPARPAATCFQAAAQSHPPAAGDVECADRKGLVSVDRVCAGPL